MPDNGGSSLLPWQPASGFSGQPVSCQSPFAFHFPTLPPAECGPCKSQGQGETHHFLGQREKAASKCDRGFPGGASGKEPVCQRWRNRDLGSIPGSGRSPGGGYGDPLQCSCLENPMDRAAWQAAVHSVAKSQTPLKQLSMHALKWLSGMVQSCWVEISC